MKQIVWDIKDLAKMIVDRQNNELDVNIVIDGPRGNGKSTLAWRLLSKTGKFNPEKDVLFSREDVMNAIKDRKFSCIDADEMINSAHNRDFFSGDQKTFIKIMNMYRDNYNVLVGSVPYFYDLDTQVRKLIKMRLTVIKRGVAIVQISKNSLYANDIWETGINKKIEESWINKMSKGRFIKPKYNLLTTYAGHLFFKELPPLQASKYKALKHQKRSDLRLDIEEKARPYWEEANEYISKGLIKDSSGLKYYLMGKGVNWSSGRNKVTSYRRDIGLSSLQEHFREAKEDKREEKSNVVFE